MRHSLPFALRILRPEAEAIRQDHARLSAALGLTPWAWVRFVYLPRLRRPLGFAAGLTAALSMGDLGVIALFGTDEFSTLPWMMYRALGAYRSNDAAMLAAILLIVAVLSFYLFPKLLGGRDDAHAQ